MLLSAIRAVLLDYKLSRLDKEVRWVHAQLTFAYMHDLADSTAIDHDLQSGK